MMVFRTLPEPENLGDELTKLRFSKVSITPAMSQLVASRIRIPVEAPASSCVIEFQNILIVLSTPSGFPIKSLEEVKDFYPAIFSVAPHPERTDRYSFLSTEEIVKRMEAFDWKVSHASQSGKSNFGRHLVRMTNEQLEGLPDFGDEIIPQIIVDNSHDGYTQAEIHLGLYRVISATGLIISIPGMHTSFRFKHVGANPEEFSDLLGKIAECYKNMMPHIGEMMKVELTNEEKEDFIIRAIAAREPWKFVDEDDNIKINKIKRLNNLEEILTPERNEDSGNDLWSVFNVIQEKMIDGGYSRISDKGRKSKTRTIAIPSRNVDLNKKLWELAEHYLETKKEEVKEEVKEEEIKEFQWL